MQKQNTWWRTKKKRSNLKPPQRKPTLSVLLRSRGQSQLLGEEISAEGRLAQVLHCRPPCTHTVFAGFSSISRIFCWNWNGSRGGGQEGKPPKHRKLEVLKKEKNIIRESDVCEHEACSVYTWHQITHSCQRDLVCTLVFLRLSKPK